MVDAAMGHKLGAFERAEKPGDSTRMVFACGTVEVDAKGKVTGINPA